MTQPPPPPPPPPFGGQPPGTPEWGNPQWAAANWGPPPPGPQGPTGGSERTGPLPLYPMALGDILDGAIKLYRANWKTVALITLVFSGPVQVLTAVLQRDVNGGYGFFDIANDPSLVEDQSPFGQFAAPIVAFLAMLLVQPLIAGAVSKAVAASYLGTQITMGDAVRAAFRRFPALLAASLLIFGTYIVGLLACCIGLLFVYPLWVATSPSIVVEELGPIKGMRRSWSLVTRRYWPVLGTVVLTLLLVQFISGMISGVPAIIGVVIGTEWGFILIAIGGIASSIVAEPISAIVFTLLYFDLRIRHEGFDLDLMSRDLARGGHAVLG